MATRALSRIVSAPPARLDEVVGEVRQLSSERQLVDPQLVEAAYRRTDFFEKRRNLMARWAEYLDRKGKDAATPASEPIPLRAAA